MLATEGDKKDAGAPSPCCIVKATLTSVLSPLRCDGTTFALDVRMEDGASTAKVTLATTVCEAMLGMTPSYYSSLVVGSPQEQEARQKLQEAIALHEGLYTLQRGYDSSTGRPAVMVISTEPVSVAYFVNLIKRVSSSAAPTHPAVAALVSKLQ